ncbi:DUF2784 domain-containing protein [soil metagenome]
MVYRVSADMLFVIHFGFLLFVVLGGLLVLRWRRVLWLHLPALIWGILVTAFSWNCPLTRLENRFLRLSGDVGYGNSFVAHYLSTVLYLEGGRQFYVVLGLLLIVWNLVVYSFALLWPRQTA